MSLDRESLAVLAAGLPGWQRRAPALGDLPAALEAHPAPFRVLAAGPRLELACEAPVRGRPNRCRLVLTPVGDGDLTVVFYRTGASGSGARYGYGGAAVVGAKLRGDQVISWLDYLAAGFEPARAPRGLRPEFQYPSSARGEPR